MSVEKIVIGIIQRDFMNIAEDVQSEFKAEVRRSIKHKAQSTGQAEGSISIMQQSPDRIFVGSDDQHLNFMIRGNGGSGSRIYAKGKALGKYPDGIPGIGWRGAVNGYDGRPEILTRVANKFR